MLPVGQLRQGPKAKHWSMRRCHHRSAGLRLCRETHDGCILEVEKYGNEVVMHAREAVRKPPVTVTSGTTIASAARTMDEKSVGALVVVDDDGHPVGIVTDRDIVIRAVAHSTPSDARIDSVMTSGVVALGADQDVRDALRIFHSHAIRRLPVVDEGEVVGMLTTDDLLVNMIGDLAEIARPITGQVVFGGQEPHEEVMPE